MLNTNIINDVDGALKEDQTYVELSTSEDSCNSVIITFFDKLTHLAKGK
jgi:hypothetical protein